MHNEKSTTAKSAPTRRESIMAHNKKAAVVKPTVNSFRKQMDTLSGSVIKESEEVEEEAAEDLPISSPKQDPAVKKGGLNNRRLSNMDPSKALFKSLVKKLRRGSVLKKADEDTVPGSLINLIDPQLHEDFEVKPLRLTEKVVSLSCGPDHCGAVTVAGCLYMWGCNLDSQLVRTYFFFFSPCHRSPLFCIPLCHVISSSLFFFRFSCTAFPSICLVLPLNGFSLCL